MCGVAGHGAQADTLKIAIEEDDTITIVTGKIGKEVHPQAEQFLQEVQELLGARKTIEELQHVHTHTHRAVKTERKTIMR